MAQRKPEENIRIQQVLNLVHELTAQEQEQLLEQLKLEDLRREIQKGIDSAERGELYSEEEVMASLDEHHRQRLESQKK